MRFSTRERWLIGSALGVALLYLACEYYVFPVIDSLAETREKIALDSKRLVNYRRLLLGQDSVQAALGEAHKQLAIMEQGLLNNRSDALANAEIQGLVKGIAEAQGLTFRRTELVPVRQISPEYARVPTRIEVIGSIDQLVQLLVRLGSADKVLSVEEMRINPVQLGNPKEKRVLATLMVSGVKRLESDAAAAAMTPQSAPQVRRAGS
ncbi:MAG: type II secretion system protein GspM [Acidobacteriota bacterium]